MLKSSRVIEEGKQAWRKGIPRHACPYPAPSEPVIQDAYHGSRLIGRVRVGIDYRATWELGWDIAEKYEGARCTP